MKSPAQTWYEKALGAAACAAVAVSMAWSWQRQSRVDAVAGEPEPPTFAAAAPGPVAFRAIESKQVWPKPEAQSEGGGWVYEVFTPPVIYYNAAARSFAVTPPHYSAEATETIFGLELVGVKLAPYRLQLAGYFGAPGNYLAAFVSSERPETLLAREGHRFEQLGLTLMRFDVRKIAVETDAAGPVYDIAALAVLHDEETGGEVVLDSRATQVTDTALAIFQSPGRLGQPRQLQEGDTFKEGDATYRIERIQLDPPEVVVARSTPGLAMPETRILRPAESGGERTAGKDFRSKSIVAPAGRGVATQGR
jgi:hypothetical protein